MSYVLFLDDDRDPPHWLGYEPIICRDISELKLTFVLYGVPGVISFDHDLGKFENGDLKPNALQGLKWMIEQHLDKVYDLNEIHQVFVHSANPQGADNIVSMWDSFAEQVLQSEVRAVRREAVAQNSQRGSVRRPEGR